MIEIGTKISISISEPWDSDKVINGIILRSINNDKYSIIREYLTDQLYIASCRYVGERLSDVLGGKWVTVGIAIPLPGINLLTIAEITQNEFQYLKYSYIGTMKLVTTSGILKKPFSLKSWLKWCITKKTHEEI